MDLSIKNDNMKKIAIIFSLALLASACGPQRYGCGPRARCGIENKENKSQIEKQAHKTQFATASSEKLNTNSYE